MRIKDIELILLDVPFHEIPARNMARQNNGWHISEICRVTSESGVVGIGETLPNYTWCKVTPEAVERVKGGNPFELMWDDSLGAGLQMALFDLAGKLAGVPVYRLLGSKHREWCPISWWSTDMSPEDFAQEAKAAKAAGYRSCKQKARMWWDVWEQARLTAEAVGTANFKLDFDFNEHLLNAAAAIPVLQDLDRCQNIAIYEEPIPRGDVEGNRRIRAATRCGIALHYVGPQVATNLRQEMCDGYVVCSGASQVMKAAHLCAELSKLFWLQLVGTGWTTAWALHLGAVCSHAQWPAVTCMNMYVDPLITEPIAVKDGFARVPEKPGLGVEFNESALKYRVSTAKKPNAEAVYAIVRDSGRKMWFHGEYNRFGFWAESWAGNLPPFERGARLEQWSNDGSQQWKEMAERLKSGPVWES